MMLFGQVCLKRNLGGTIGQAGISADSKPCRHLLPALLRTGYALARQVERNLDREASEVWCRVAGERSRPTRFVSQENPAIDDPRFVSQTGPTSRSSRAEINRANAQHSTGPRSVDGKLTSSRNSLKHGLAGGTLLIPGEDSAAFEALRDALLQEHQPATETEEILVREMAQSYWLTQRAIRLQNECFTPEGVDQRQLSLFLRYQTTHDRAFYKALNMLMRLQKERRKANSGFVSQKSAPSLQKARFVSQETPEGARCDDFVSQTGAKAIPNLLKGMLAA